MLDNLTHNNQGRAGYVVVRNLLGECAESAA